MSNLITVSAQFHRQNSYENHSDAQFNYTQREWKLRLEFVAEYTKDWDEVTAMMRCGYVRDVAREYAKQFLEEPAVQKLIEDFKCPPWLAKNKSEAEKQVLSMLWREANFFGFGSSPTARISATRHIATLLKMDPAHKDIKPPQLLDSEAMASLPLEEQQTLVALLKKVTVNAK